MSEAARIRAAKASLAVDCPWCGEPAGAKCRTVDNKQLMVPHEQRQSAHYAAERAKLRQS